MVEHVQQELGVSERRACKVLGQSRSTQRYEKRVADDEPYVVSRIVALACQFGRYGYRRITELLRREDICINHKRVQRIWRQEGLKVPSKQPKRRRLWLNDGSCVRRRPRHKDDVWSYDFVADRTHDGKPFRMLTIIDEYTRECLATRAARKLNSEDVIDCLADLFVQRTTPAYLRSDNGAEFTAKAVREWLRAWASTRCSSRRGAPGRTATSSRSTASCATSCWIGRSSTRSVRRRS